MNAEAVAALLIALVGLLTSFTVARRLYSPLMSLVAVATVAVGSSALFDLAVGGSLVASLAIATVALAVRLAGSTRSTGSTGSPGSMGSTGFGRWVGVVLVAAVAIALQQGELTTIGNRGYPIDALWSSGYGLFATSPALYLAGIGVIPLWRRERRLAAAALIVFLLALVTAPRAGVQTAGHFSAMVPFFVCGMAAIMDLVTRTAARRPALAAAAALSLLVLWNVTLMAVTRAGGHRIGEPVSFGDLAAAQAATLHDWIGHPASYPANLIYAVRYGVAPGRYDVLMPNRLLADPAHADGRIDVGANDAPFLEDGWHDAERAATTTFRWSRRESQLIVPLDRAADLRVTAAVRAFTFPGAPAQAMVLTINGRALPPQTIGAEWQTVEWTTPRDLWRAGVNRVTLRFTYEMRPSEIGLGGDSRLLAGAVDQIRITRQ